MVEEIYIDRECMESKVDWMQSELNKVIREMERKSVSQHLHPGHCVLSPQTLPNVSLVLFWHMVGAGLKKVNVGKREDITEIKRDHLTFHRHLQDTESYDLYEGEYLKYPVAIKTFKRPLTTDPV